MNPIADDIPTDTAWQEGRRIYIRCPKGSPLDDKLYAMKATWDREAGARFVGTTRRDAVLPLIREHLKTGAERQQLKETGERVAIPFALSHVRQHAKANGAVWDADAKEWVCSPKVAAEVRAMLAATPAAKAAKAEPRRRTNREVLAESGRTLSDGESLTSPRRFPIPLHLPRGTRRAQAQQHGHRPGQVIRVKEGRALILKSSVQFASAEDVEDGLVAGQPGWSDWVTAVLVEPTPDEVAADAERERKRQDAATLARVFAQVGSHVDEDTSRVPDGEAVAVIRRTSGITSRADGDFTITRDGRVVWHHPGTYDMWIEVTRVVRSPLADEVRALAERGARSVARGGDTFTIEVHQ